MNELPDVDYLVQQLSFLIENPDEITKIINNAKAFIEREHDYVRIAATYLAVWNTT